MEKYRKFWERLAKLPRQELLDLIEEQDPKLIMEVNRIEWVFAHKLKHLTWSDGTPITGRPVTNEELALLIDPPFEVDRELTAIGLSPDQQRQVWIASDACLWARHFLKIRPRAYQVLMLRHPQSRKVLRAGRRLGKALHVDTPIPTPDGWKKMGELQEGDKVFDEKGKPCNVTFATDYQYDHRCYEVQFSDGSTLIADEDHEWTVDTKSSRKARGRAINPQSLPVTLTTKQMLDSLYVECGNKLEVNYSIETSGPVEYAENDLPLDPWVFGLWLADGTSREGVITMGDQDYGFLSAELDRLGYKHTKMPSAKHGYKIDGLFKQLNALSCLKKYQRTNAKTGVVYPANLQEKFIPRIFLQGSVQQREALLQGLMDGDGTASGQLNGNCEFSVCNKRLAEDVYELIQSLGYRATWKESDATLNGRIVGTRYRINWTPWRAVFRIPRKLARQNLQDQPSSRLRCRYIVAIKLVDSVPVKCIGVDSPSSLYLAGKNFIPTHNSWTMALFMLHYAYTHNHGRVLVLTPMKTHAEVLFKELEKMIAGSTTIKESVRRSITSPHPIVELANGSTIRFFSTGMSSGGKANVARGQEADVIVLDELDYMGPEDLDAIIAMLTKTSDGSESKTLIGASTPTGKREKFWEWCTRGTRPNPETGTPARFREFWFPSYVNPYFDKEQEQEFRDEYKESVYRHEIEAEWGEDIDGVFARRYLDTAFSIADWRYKAEIPARESFFLMGVDWDKYGAGTNILVLEVCNEYYPDETFSRKIRPVFREETTRDEFTYTKAVRRIIELNEIFQPQHIYVDRGSGEMQVEELKRHGMDHPETMLSKRVRGISFSENVIAYDPVNKQEIKKKMKPFMVDNLQRILEREYLVLPTSDEHLYRQMLGYTISRTTQFGDPVFQEGEAGDHALDALMLACLALTQNYGDMLKVNLARYSKAVSNRAFVPLIELSTNSKERSDQEEIVEETFGSKTAAPVLRQRAMAKPQGAKSRRTITRRLF